MKRNCLLIVLLMLLGCSNRTHTMVGYWKDDKGDSVLDFEESGVVRAPFGPTLIQIGTWKLEGNILTMSNDESPFTGRKAGVSIPAQIEWIDNDHVRFGTGREDGVGPTTLTRLTKEEQLDLSKKSVADEIQKEQGLGKEHPVEESKVQSVSCASNLKQVSLGALMYAQDYDDALPEPYKWTGQLDPYIKNTKVYDCPAVAALGQHNGYAISGQVAGSRTRIFEAPQSTLLFLETVNLSPGAAGDLNSLPNPSRHDGKNSFSYVDGHVKSILQGQNP